MCQDREIPVWLRRLRHQYFQTDDSSGSQDFPEDHEGSSLPDPEVDTSNRELELQSGSVDNSQPSAGQSDSISHQTRAGRPVRPPNKYKDFC